MITKLKCPICGGKLSEKSLKGTVFPWKEFPFVALTADVRGPQCEKCGEILLRGSQLKVLDEALELSIREVTADYISNLKENVHATQKDIARKIGCSKEYLSELVSKKKTPSLQFFNLLKLLALYPNGYYAFESFLGKFADGFIGPSPLREKYRYLSDEQISELPHTSKLKLLRFEG